MSEGNFIDGKGFGHALAWCTILTVIIIFSLWPIASSNLHRLAGPVMLGLGCLPLLILRALELELSSVGADIAFGAFDTGFMTVGALIEVSFAGILGALIGAGAGDAITDAYAGMIEGKIATWLREKGIDEARKPLGTALGKMSGCLIGAGTTISIASLVGLI